MSTPITQSFWKSFRFWCTSYYCRRYSEKFAHARKLFCFDILLIVTGCVALYLGLSWFLRTPAKPTLLDISFDTLPARVVSGGEISVYVTLHNTSNQALTNLSISPSIPPGFLIARASLNDRVYPSSSLHQIIYAEHVAPDESLNLTLSGRLYGSVGADTPIGITAQFESHNLPDKQLSFARLFLATRASVIHTTVHAPEHIIRGVPTSIPVSIQNAGPSPLTVALPLNIPVATGSGRDSMVEVPAGKTIEKNIPITVSDSQQGSPLAFVLEPSILFQGMTYAQEQIEFSIPLIQPGIDLHTQWTTNASQPDTQQTLIAQVYNIGDTPIDSLELVLSKKEASAHGITPPKSSVQRDGDYILPLGNHTGSLAPNEQTQAIRIPFFIGSKAMQDRAVRIPLRIRATIDGSVLEVPFQSAPLPVASTISIQKDIRFYTKEGDQIGRGELPFRVGSETRVWAILTIHNSTSRVDNLSLVTTLSPGVSWTGNASVSRGAQPTYNSSTNTLTWNALRLEPFSTASINLELSLTPTSASEGTIPRLVERVSLSAQDAHTNLQLTTHSTSITLKDTQDTKLLSKGLFIQ